MIKHWILQYKNIILATLGGSLAGLSFPNPIYPEINWLGGWLSWICLIPLFFIQTKGYKKMFWYGSWYGFIYFGSSIIWIAGMESMAPLGPLAWLLLAAYMAIYIGLFLVGKNFLIKQGLPWWLTVSSIWVILEYCRNYIISGFPWVSLGYAHYGNGLMMSTLPAVGIWGLSWLTVVGNCLVFILSILIIKKITGQNNYFQEAYQQISRSPKSYIILSSLLVLIIWGSIYEYQTKQANPSSTNVVVAALQGNINQNTSWDRTYKEKTLATYKMLIEKAALQQTNLVVWPETAFPGIFNYDQVLTNRVKQWSKDYRLHQILGADIIELKDKEYLYYNAMIMIDDQGQEREHTSKKHLVPFGEYVPYKDSWLFFIHKIVSRYRGSGFTPGKARRLLPLIKNGAEIPIGGVICFESLFSQYTRNLVRQGAQLLAVITYDTWFGHSSAPAQHAIFSAFRAAETNRYLIRAGASGISCIFDNYGKNIGLLELDKTDLLVRKVKAIKDHTIYIKWGDWIVVLLLIILVLYWSAIKGMIVISTWRRKD